MIIICSQRSSNPIFLATITFRASDGITECSEVRFTVYDVRERLTSTALVIGQLSCVLGSIKAIDRVRLPIRSPENSTRHVGFLTIVIWNLKREERSSTESTPCRLNPYENQNSSSALVCITNLNDTQVIISTINKILLLLVDIFASANSVIAASSVL